MVNLVEINKIITWLNKHDINEYTINDDLTIDVKGHVGLYKYPDKELPKYIQFNKIEGDFDICFSNIISLKGCPKECYRFGCYGCNSLTSLEGCPEKCEEFDCSYCEKLTSLEGAPTKCEEFYCRHCKGNFTEEDVRKVCDAKKIYD